MSPVQDLIYWELVIRRPWFAPWRRVVECPFCGLRRPLTAWGRVSVSSVVGAGVHACEAHHEALAHVLWARYGKGRKWNGRRRIERVGAE